MNDEKIKYEMGRIEYHLQNEKFVRDLKTKELFMFDWSEGAVLPLNHPNYYDGRIDISIRKINNNKYGYIEIEKDKYELSDDLVNNIYQYVVENIDRLIKITLNQTEDAYDGVYNHICIKFKSLYLDIDVDCINNTEDIEFINALKELVKKMTLSSKKIDN